MSETRHNFGMDPRIELSEIAPIPPEYAVARQAAELLQTQAYEAYFVGGAVRDLLLGKAPKDFDLTTNATPEQILATPGFLKSTFKDTAQAYAVTRVRLQHPDSEQEGDAYVEMEIATFRKDIDAHLGRKETKVELAVQLETDVMRRDLTINALALDPINNQLVDYVGGLEDLRQGIIRFVGDPAERIREDPLRILRAIRFRHRFGFTYDPATDQAMRDAISTGRLEGIPADRLRNELTTLLTPASRRPALEDLERFGALDHLLPELMTCRGVEQSPDVHAEGDVWQHKLFFMEKLTGPPGSDGRPTVPSRRLLWGALLRDIGKPAMQRMPLEPGGRITFYDHDRVGAEMTKSLLSRFRFSNKELAEIGWLEANHMLIQRLPEMSAGKQRELMNHPAFADLLEICRADGLASWAEQPDGSINKDQKASFAAIEAIWQEHRNRSPELQKPSLKRDLGIDGLLLADWLGLPFGKELGTVLRSLEAQHSDQPFVDQPSVLAAGQSLLRDHLPARD
jgi:poly(A) polymerase